MRILAFLAVLAWSSPVLAQTPNCSAQWSRLVDAMGRLFGMSAPAPGLFRQTADKGCRTNGLVFPVNEHVVVKAESLTWSGRDMDRFVEGGLPPTGIALTLSGIRIVPQVGDKTFQYLQDVQSRGQNIEVSLSVNWDAADNVVSVDNLLISLPSDDFIRFEAQVEGVDLSTAESLRNSAISFGVTLVDLEIRSERIFQNYLLLPLGMVLLEGQSNPEARVDELKDIAKTAVEGAPSQLVSEGSKAALLSLVEDLPEPAGTLRLQQTANPGIGVARGLAFGMQAERAETLDDLWPLFDGIDVEITYDRF